MKNHNLGRRTGGGETHVGDRGDIGTNLKAILFVCLLDLGFKIDEKIFSSKQKLFISLFPFYSPELSTQEQH